MKENEDDRDKWKDTLRSWIGRNLLEFPYYPSNLQI